MKKILKITAAIVGFILLVLLIVPFFINVDKFRPQLESKAGEALNAKVELGKLGLRLIPNLTISSDRLVVTPKDPRFPESVIKSDKFKISIPLLSLLGAPRATLQLDQPEIFVVEREGKLNVSTMTSENKPNDVNTKPPAAEESDSSFLSRKLANAKLSLLVSKANIKYQTPKNNVALIVDELQLDNLGLNSSTDLKLKSSVDFKGENALVKGPFEFSGIVKSEKLGEAIKLNFDIEGDFSKTQIKTGSTFDKPENVPLKFNFVGQAEKGTETSLQIEKLKFQLASFEVDGSAGATGIGSENAQVHLDVKNGTSKLEDLSDLSPLLADYKLKGAVEFFAKVNGPQKNPTLDIYFQGKNLTGKTPKLNLPIKQLDVQLKVKGTLEDPIVELDPADILVGSSDVQIKLVAQGLKEPKAKVDISSKSLDLAFLTTGDESKAGKSTSSASPQQGKALDAALDEMAPTVEKSLRNKLLDRAQVNFSLRLGEVKLKGTKLSNVNVGATLNSRVLTVKQANFSGYSGSVGLSGTSKLIPSAPTFNYVLKLQNISLEQAIVAHAPAWNGQLGGSLSGNAAIKGEGIKKTQVAANLGGSIKGTIVHGHTSLELSKIVSLIMKQLPQKPDLKGNATGERLKGKFRTLEMSSRIVGRKIDFDNLNIVFEPDEYNLGEVQFKATGWLNFERQLELVGNVFLSPQVLRWPEAVGPSGKIEIPVKITGPMDGAKPDYGYTISKMGGRVLKNTLQNEAKKGLQNILQGKNPGDLLKGLFK